MTNEERASRFLTSWMLGRAATPEEVLRQRWEPEFLTAIAAEFEMVREETMAAVADERKRLVRCADALRDLNPKNRFPMNPSYAAIAEAESAIKDYDTHVSQRAAPTTTEGGRDEPGPGR